MAATIPGAELVVIPDAGHSPQFENGPAWLATLQGSSPSVDAGVARGLTRPRASTSGGAARALEEALLLDHDTGDAAGRDEPGAVLHRARGT